MKLSTLSVKLCGEHGLSFQLLIDGKSLKELIGGDGGALPLWEVDQNGLRAYPWDKESDSQAGWRIVSVCECGESGCSHTRVWVEHNGGTVDWNAFGGKVSAVSMRSHFRFEADNYRDVMSRISESVREKCQSGH